MDNLTNCIKKIKMNEKEEFEQVISFFNPILNKYARLLYKDELEDTRSELICALWEAVSKIDYYENEGQIIKYLSRSVFLRYLELYRLSRQRNDYEQISIDDTMIEIPDIQNNYENVIYTLIKDDILSHYKGKQKEIAKSIMSGNYSDIDIASFYKVSRQYVHKIKKNIRKHYQTLS